MRLHPRGLLVLFAFAALLIWGVRLPWAIPAAVAIAVVDWLSFGGLFLRRR